jgi:hypothetical protein
MATPTYVPLATETLSATDASITFGSIDTSTYRDLKVVIDGEGIDPYAVIYYRLNGDSGSNYTGVYMRGYNSGTQSSTYSTTGALVTVSGFEGTDDWGNVISDFLDAGASDKHKTILSRSNYVRDAGSGSVSTEAWASRWANTDAITSIEVYIVGGGLATGSVISLYGIEA